MEQKCVLSRTDARHPEVVQRDSFVAFADFGTHDPLSDRCEVLCVRDDAEAERVAECGDNEVVLVCYKELVVVVAAAVCRLPEEEFARLGPVCIDECFCSVAAP